MSVAFQSVTFAPPWKEDDGLGVEARTVRLGARFLQRSQALA